MIPIESKAKMMAIQATNRWQDSDELRWAARHWATRIGVRTPQIQFRDMRRKWASLSTVGRLTLNTELIELPKDLGEFVIVHELVHLLAPNHGRVFKSFMHAYLPDWETRETRLHEFARKQPPKGGVLAAIRRSPLVGTDLKIKRPFYAGRNVDL